MVLNRQRRNRPTIVVGLSLVLVLTFLCVGVVSLTLVINNESDGQEGEEVEHQLGEARNISRLFTSNSSATNATFLGEKGEKNTTIDALDVGDDAIVAEVITEEEDSANATLDPTTTIQYHPPPPTEEECLPDRFDNIEMDVLDVDINIKRLYPGQFICSKPYRANRYRFGLNLEGSLIWKDTTRNQIHILRDNHNSGQKEEEDVDSNAWCDREGNCHPKRDDGEQCNADRKCLSDRCINNICEAAADVVEKAVESSTPQKVYFELTTDGTMVIKSQQTTPGEEEEVLWTRPAEHLRDRPMIHYPRCLYNHDCPYLHLHADGVMVLNWINPDDGWQVRNFLRVYGLLDDSDHGRIDCSTTDACR